MAQERGQFSSKLGFILAAAGSAVGLGNLVAFPVGLEEWRRSFSNYLSAFYRLHLLSSDDG